VTGDDGFADRYEEWSAHLVEDVPFPVDLARAADRPLVATGSSPPMLEQARV